MHADDEQAATQHARRAEEEDAHRDEERGNVRRAGTATHGSVASDVERIDNLQLKHSALFDQVPEYNGLKRPKHHFLTHLAVDVWRYGPPRGYWCFGFESFNKVIKAGSQRTNWKNESVGIMQYCSMKSASRLHKL